MKEHLNPPTLMVPEDNSYTQVVTTTESKTIYVSGQVSWDREGNVLHPGDLRAQTAKALDNVRLGLEAAGAKPKDIVRMRIYVVDYSPECIPNLMAVLQEFFGDTPTPANTLVGVSALFLPEMLVEIDTIATV